MGNTDVENISQQRAQDDQLQRNRTSAIRPLAGVHPVGTTVMILWGTNGDNYER
jgi:hypothetical protein